MPDVGLREVALEARRRDGQSAAREEAQEFVVERRRAQHRVEFGMRGRVMPEHVEHLRALVAQQEFDRAILRRLESARTGQRGSKRFVLGRRQRLQHRPLLEQLLLDELDARQDLEARVQRVGANKVDGRLQFVDHQLHPQLRDLVLDDEQHLVVARRLPVAAGQRYLRRQQVVEAKVAAVRQAVRQVGDDAGFEIARAHVIEGGKYTRGTPPRARAPPAARRCVDRRAPG